LRFATIEYGSIQKTQSRGGGGFNVEPQTSPPAAPATPAFDPNEEPF